MIPVGPQLQGTDIARGGLGLINSLRLLASEICSLEAEASLALEGGLESTSLADAHAGC